MQETSNGNELGVLCQFEFAFHKYSPFLFRPALRGNNSLVQLLVVDLAEQLAGDPDAADLPTDGTGKVPKNQMMLAVPPRGIVILESFSEK